MRTKLYTALALAFAIIVVGCATLNPGADPLVVRVEQVETSASATFDMVLRVDNAQRGFWITNAPAFHNFCEWLRTQTPYSTNTVARCVAMQLNVDDLKLAYKSAKTTGNSNALYTAFGVLTAAVGQASAWETIVTTPTHP